MDNLNELKMRKALCEYALNLLQSVADEDPRKIPAIENYRGQLERIEQRIKNNTQLEPAPIVINLQPGKLFGIIGGQ